MTTNKKYMKEAHKARVGRVSGTGFSEDDTYGYRPSDATKAYEADEQDARLGNISPATLKVRHDAQIEEMNPNSFVSKVRKMQKEAIIADEDKKGFHRSR
jgi:hypothetical protein